MRRRRKALAAGCCLGLSFWPNPTDAVGLGPDEVIGLYHRMAIGAVVTGGTFSVNNVNRLPPCVVIAGEVALASAAAGIVLDDVLKARARGTACSLAPDSSVGVAEPVVDWDAWHPPMVDPMAGRHYPTVNLTDSTALRPLSWVGLYEAGHQFGMFITADGAHEGPNTYGCFVERDGRIGCYSAHTVVAPDHAAYNKSLSRAPSIDSSFASFTSARGSYRVAEGAQLTCTSSRANASFCRVVTDSVECMVGSDKRVGCAAPAGGAGAWYGDESGGCSAANGIIHCTAAESTVNTMGAGAHVVRRAIATPESPSTGRNYRPRACLGTPVVPLALGFIIVCGLAMMKMISEKLSGSRKSSATAAAGTSVAPSDAKGESAPAGGGEDKDTAAGDRGASQDSTPAPLEPKGTTEGSKEDAVGGVKGKQQSDEAHRGSGDDGVGKGSTKQPEKKELEEDEDEEFFKSMLLPGDVASGPHDGPAQGDVVIDRPAGSPPSGGSEVAKGNAPSSGGSSAQAPLHKGHGIASTQVPDAAAPKGPPVRGAHHNRRSRKTSTGRGPRSRKVLNSGQAQVLVDAEDRDSEDDDSGNDDGLVEDLLAKVESLHQQQDQALDAHNFDLELQKEEYEKKLRAETREKDELLSKTLAATSRANHLVGLLREHGIGEFGQKVKPAAPVRPAASPAPVPAMKTAERRKLEALIATLRTDVSAKDARIAVLQDASATKDKRIEAQAVENREMRIQLSTVSEYVEKLLHKFNGDIHTDQGNGKADSKIVAKVQILGDILSKKDGRICSLESLLADSIVTRHVVVRRAIADTRKPWQDVVATKNDRICALEGIIAEQVVRSHIAVSRAARETRTTWKHKMESEVGSRDAKIRQLGQTVNNFKKVVKEKQRLKAIADATSQSLRGQVRDLRRELRRGPASGPVQPAPPPYPGPAAAIPLHQQQPVAGVSPPLGPGAPLRPWPLPFACPPPFTTQPRGPGGPPTYTQQPYGGGFGGNGGGWDQGYRGGYQTGVSV